MNSSKAQQEGLNIEKAIESLLESLMIGDNSKQTIYIQLKF